MIHAEIVAAETPIADPAPARRRHLLVMALLLIWLLACAAMIAMYRQDIATFTFGDPDDQLRLLEVRDWLAGQSWWDVTQHRMNPPGGGLMHWSRLIDIPIGLAILLARPLVGAAQAETVAAVVVPMLTLGFCMAMTAWLARRLVGPAATLPAALFAAISPGAITQMRPMRVDHHGWQIGIAAAVLIALIDRRPTRSGLFAGALLALWLRISLEGVPLAAAAGALVGLRWALSCSPDENDRLVAFFGALAACSALLFAGLIPIHQWPVTWCDAISIQHIEMFATAFVGGLALRLVPPRPLLRLAAGGVVALACLGVYHSAAPRCGLDPFGNLDPLVRKIWYDNILEGMPIWRTSADVGVLMLGYPALALLGGTLALRASQGRERAAWGVYLFMCSATFIAAVFVQRVGGTATVVAVPGGLWLMIAGMRRAQTAQAPVRRVLGSVAAVILFMPLTPTLAGVLLLPNHSTKHSWIGNYRTCASTANLRALNVAPTGLVLAPLDLGPGIMLDSHHDVISGSYHRNDAAIGTVIRASMGSLETAHAIIARRHVAYVAFCDDTAPVGVDRDLAPNGLAARLADGRAPTWLQPVPLGRPSVLRLWKVVS
ncbi:MAG: hypothetical protein JOY99_08465 [Sphingomonadaceae bacterium]|nr:hypothetical protein [Sphingomonadaceae bacterium]